MSREKVVIQKPFLFFSVNSEITLLRGCYRLYNQPAQAAQGRRSCRLMFARLVVFGQSVFSPERKPMTLQYRNRAMNGAQATKPVIKSIKAAARAEDITSVLGTDELDLVLMAVYQSCERAPMCAAVSREFKRAKEAAEKGSMAMLVAPHRRHMKIASKPSLIPSVEEDTAVIQTWGETLELYVPEDLLLSCDKDDMRRILERQAPTWPHEVSRNGWLSNFAVDAYMSKLMPRLADAEPGALRVFLPGAHTLSLFAKGTLGLTCKNGENGEIDFERTDQLRAHAQNVLAGAEELYVNFNLGNDSHRALMRV